MIKNLNVYVINLKDQKFKREKIKDVLNNFSFNYEFFDAYDGRNSSINDYDGYNDFKRKLFLGRSLLPQELGTFESHRLLLKKIIKEQIQLALIFEDDVEINTEFEKYVSKIIQIKYKWELIRFISREKINKIKGRKVYQIDNKVSLYRFPKLLGEAHAYLITYDGAKKILKLTKDFYHHIDIIMGETWKNNLNSLFCLPGFVCQDPKLNIVAKNHPRFVKKSKSLFEIYTWSRFFFKLYETIGKWIHYSYFFIPDIISCYKSKKKLNNFS